MRRVAAVVGTALMVSACGLDGPPLRRGWAEPETTTTTASAAPSGSAVAEVRRIPATKPKGAPERFALPATVLAADGLEVQESAAEMDSPLFTLCGNQVSADGGYRIVTKSTSGASSLVQEIADLPGGGGTMALAGATCPGAEKLPLPAGQIGWCESRAGGRGACTVLVATEKAVVSLKFETVSVDRARDVAKRLAVAVAAQLPKA